MQKDSNMNPEQKQMTGRQRQKGFSSNKRKTKIICPPLSVFSVLEK
jgi:hypothetical protein